MQVLLILFASHVIVMLAHTAGLVLASRLAGASISEIGIFIGPTLFKINIRGVALKLNLLPTGSYVKYDADEPDRRRATRSKRLEDLNPLTRAVIASAGCLALLLVAVVYLGPSAAIRHTVSGFSQIISGTLSPLEHGARLLQLLYQFASTMPLPATLGLVASKEAAFNLLPLPVFNGGDIILNLINLVKRIPDLVIERLNMFGFLLMIAIWACWLIALVYSLGG